MLKNLLIGSSILYFCYWVLRILIEYIKTGREAKEKEKAEKEFANLYLPKLLEYRRKYKDIRDRYDPKLEWNEGTTIPKEYFEEIDSLQQEHSEMIEQQRTIERRFGNYSVEDGYFIDYH